MPEGRFPAGRWLAIAAVAGVLAGAAAVYVRDALEGNTPPAVQAPQPVAAGPEDAACAPKAEKAKTVAAAATGEVAAMLPTDPPRALGALSFNGPDGKPMKLSDRAGKTVLVNLWATWCLPCREEMPALDALQKEMGGDRFEVMAINVDTGGDEKPKKFLDEIRVSSLAFYRENSLALFNELKRRGLLLGLPATLLVDGEGCLLAHMNGPAEWSGADAERLIRTALDAG